MWWKLPLLLAWLVVGGGGCHTEVSFQTTALPTADATASAQSLQALSLWHDGSYIGVSDVPTPQLIRVAVDITSGRIAAIRVLQHPAWRAPQEQERLLRLVVDSQTTAGHVSRDTGSEQDRLLRAIDDALTRARSVTPSVP
jgi:uncharacterized protein with FMN-binding domain